MRRAPRRLAGIVLGSLLAWLTVVEAHGIITRHDRDDARYVALGAQFGMVGSIGRAGEGTLIAPTWVLTAAHVAAGTRAKAVTFDGREYPVARKFAHPRWTEMGPHDIGLIELSEPVAGIPPVGIYTATDEVGQMVTFVGHGGSGTGLTGPTFEDRKRRAATSVIEAADAAWLRFTFHEGASAQDLEGISGPGDSGGPALISRDGAWLVAGVSVFGEPGTRGRGTYGAKEGYTRVSAYQDWVRATLAGRSQPLSPD